MKYLDIQDENPVVLRGYLDAAGAFQLTHEHGTLAEPSQSLQAAHATATSITIELHDFDGWQLSAGHEQSWPRGTDYAYYAFTAMSEPLEVTVTASNGAQAQTRNIYIKTKPKGSLPAH